MVEERIQKKRKKDTEDPILQAIYLLLRKLKGHSIKDILEMPIPQFLCLVEMTIRELEQAEQAHKKANRKKR